MALAVTGALAARALTMAGYSAATAVGTMVAADAADIAVFGTEAYREYREGERIYEYALGASPMIGKSDSHGTAIGSNGWILGGVVASGSSMR